MALIPRIDVVADGQTKKGMVTGCVFVYNVARTTVVHFMGEPLAAVRVCPLLGITVSGTLASLSALKSDSRRIDA